MTTYLSDVKTNKKFQGNVVIKIADSYFAIREPDSGLNIGSPWNKLVMSLNLNPTQIDIRRVTTTISNFSFRLVDYDGAITALVGGDATDLIGQAVDIWLGRSNCAMDFADYYQLPTTYLLKCDHSDNSYTFTTSEQTERMAKPIYNFKSALNADILAATTIWSMRDDISTFPTSGFLKCEDEYVSYTSLDLVNNRFNGVVRGELSSVAVDHAIYSDVQLAEVITDNPINIILKILISGGGGGTYDTLQDGLGISNTLIDLTEIEALRDNLFNGVSYKLVICDVASALKLIETELLAPNNLRFSVSLNSKVTLAILDKAQFVEDENIIDEDTITKYPKWAIDGTKVTNQIEIEWDYSDGLNVFQKRNVYSDSDSITAYGAQTPLKFQFKAIKASLDGLNLIAKFGTKLLARLAYPTPIVTVNTQLDKSLQTIGDKAYLQSSKIPASDGTLNFASDLEIISRSLNWSNGDVQFQLAFTSYTSIRSGFIAPSDAITSIVSQSKVNIALGRSAQYKVGWYMRLYDTVLREYTADPPNKIVALEDFATGHIAMESGDVLLNEDGSGILLEQASTEDSIVFENAFTTPITYPNNYAIRFAEYDDASTSQKRYAFISELGNNFSDDKPSYKVTY